MLKEKIQAFPRVSGVYLMKDEKGQIIYVGKAKNLRQRVRQYFTEQDSRVQIKFLMDRVFDIDFLQTATEKDALLLENSLIKKHKPRYNFFLKDDKTYLCLKITAHDYPRLKETRKILNDGAQYFGPFTSGESLREVKEFIYRTFQLRTCSDHEFKIRTRPCLEYQIKRCSAPCVNYVSQEDYQKQIKSVELFLHGKSRDFQKHVKTKMQEASKNLDFENAARFRDLLGNMKNVLEKQQVTRLSFEFVDVMAFERQQQKIGIAVLMIRDAKLIDSKYFILTDLGNDKECLQKFITQYYTGLSFIPKEIWVPFALPQATLLQQILKDQTQFSVKITCPQKGKRRKLMTLAKENLESHFFNEAKSTEQIQKILENIQNQLHLKRVPHRIECYDVSNISGKNAVGSLVVFEDGKAQKHLYKKFKIKTLDTPNDFAMLKEVLERRLKNTGWDYPDLILIDGGKGQLAQVKNILAELDIEIDIAAIAKGRGPGARAKGDWQNKKQEDFYIPQRKNPIHFARQSRELKLLQNIRDESHRFAIAYHRHLRDKKITASWLDHIKGIGPKKKATLLKKFGSPQKIAQASDEDLLSVPGLTLKLIQKIKEQKQVDETLSNGS